MIRIDNPTTMIAPNQAGVADSGTSFRSGHFMGQQVTVKNVQSSILSDSAEEITLALADKAESKDIEERKVETARLPRSMPVPEILEYLENSQQGDAEEMAALAKQMAGGQGNPRQLAQQGSQNVTQQYLTLQYGAREGEQSGASQEQLEAIYDAIADMDLEFGSHIRADLNSVDAAAEYGSAEDIAAFQDTYRDVVLGESSLSQTLVTVLNRFGDSDFAKGLNNLVRALGADLAAARPSTEPARLQALVQDLYHLEVTATILDSTRALAKNLADKHGASNVDPVKLMSELVGITSEKWVSGPRFGGLADRFIAHDITGQIAFLTASKAILRDLPVKVYPDPDARQSVLNAVQDALDAAIDREEEQA